VALGWTDEKIHQHLQKMNYIDPNTKKEFRNRSLDPAFLEQIWKPDIFIGSILIFIYYQFIINIINFSRFKMKWSGQTKSLSLAN